ADHRAVSDPIEIVRRAVEQSPDNAPLRRHLGDLLVGAGRYEEALPEYEAALGAEPSPELQLAVAECFLELGRIGEAAVLVEYLLDRGDGSTKARALVLHCRLLLNEGELERAREAYRRAVAVDPAAVDPRLSDLLAAADVELADPLPEQDDVATDVDFPE